MVAGGGSGRIMIYDLEAERRSLSIVGHAEDGESEFSQSPLSP